MKKTKTKPAAFTSRVIHARYCERRTILPDGDIIGWKTCRTRPNKQGGRLLVKLLIPALAWRVGGYAGRKCRASYARVLWVQNGGVAYSHYGCGYHKKNFTYKKGKTVRAKNFNDSPYNECLGGIHFFITRKEAIEYGESFK